METSEEKFPKVWVPEETQEMNRQIAAGRSHDQPSGPHAQLTGVDFSLCSSAGVDIENLEALFSEACCPECSVPIGKRTRRRMRVRYTDALSRRCGAVMAQQPSRLGPTYRLYSQRFLSILSPVERRLFTWKPVEIVNRTKITPDLFEIVGSTTHAKVVALRGGNPDWLPDCVLCDRRGVPRYPLVGCLPDWLNPRGNSTRLGQPDEYVAAESLPSPTPSWFTYGDWTVGAQLAVLPVRWAEISSEVEEMGIYASRLGRVNASLIEV